MEFAKLFEPGKIGTLEVPNRIVMAPMGTFIQRPGGYVTDEIIRHYARRARGGVGLITVEAVIVVETFQSDYAMSVAHDKFISGLRRLSQAIHDYGARCALQIWHPGMILGNDPCGPSAVPNLRKGVVPREMSQAEIASCVEAFAEAGRRVKEAGFDALEYHGAHGYLISSFFSPLTNRRTDEYGGSPEKRSRFALEILARTRDKVGPDFPIIMRMNGADFAPGGMTIEDTLIRAPLVAGAGANALHISASAFEGDKWQFLSYLYPQGAISHLAAAVKRVVDVPVIAVGKISDPVFADKLLAEDKADFVAVGRALLADPDWANKARQGRLGEIRRCLACTMCSPGNGRARGLVDHHGIGCTVNPSLLFGWDKKGYEIVKAAQPKRVMVIGAGLAGMEVARVAAERGHDVSLYEKASRLGGQWNYASSQDYKNTSNFPELIAQLAKDLYSSGAKVFLNTEVTPRLVGESRPDAIIVATGARPATLGVPGETGKNVVQANDVITGKAMTGTNVVVIGGRFVGMEVALSLAGQGKKVSLLTRQEIGRGVPKLIRRTLKDRLIEAGVYMYPRSPVVEIREDGVRFVDGEEFRFLPAETVVLATGTVPQTELVEALSGSAPEMYSIGDCVTSRGLLQGDLTDLAKLSDQFQNPIDNLQDSARETFRDAFTAMHEANLIGRKI